MTQEEKQQISPASQPAPAWLPFSKRIKIADRHGIKVTPEFNDLVRDVLQTYLETYALRAASATAESVLEDAALSSEQQRAIFESYESAASESYFEVRPQIDCNDRRRVFKAGYERGWDAARKQGEA